MNQFVLAHAVVAFMAMLAPALTRAFRDDVSFAPNLTAAWRLVIVGALSAVGTIADQAQNGADLASAALAVLVSAGPSLVIELIYALSGKSGPPGGGGGNRATVPNDEITKREVKPQPGPYGVPLAAALGFAALLAVVPACVTPQPGPLPPVVSDVEMYVQDASLILDTIGTAERAFFVLHPDAAVQADIEKAIGECKLGINAALETLKGLQSATAADIGQAFLQFRAAYDDLLALLREAGVPGFGAPARAGALTAEKPMPRPRVLGLYRGASK